MKTKKQPFFDTTGVVAVAHRGGDGAGFAKRNTMAAFRSAHKLGYKYIETDVVETKDGQVIIAHGARTRLGAYFRSTFTFGRLRRLNYKEIRHKLRVGGERVPLLQEVLEAFPDSRFFIDPKTDGAIEPLSKLLSELKVLDRVLINSFEYRRLVQLQKLLGPEAQLGLLIGRNPKMMDRLYRLRSGRLSHLEAISINHWLAGRRRIKLIHRQDLKAVVWTVNSQRGIRRAMANGADVIISDRSQLLKDTVLELDPKNTSLTH